MEQQTLITLVGLVVAVLTLIVVFASLLHFSQKSLREDLGERIDQLDSRKAAERAE